MKIYLASSWRNPDQPRVLELLRSEGHEVYDFRNPKPDDTGFSWAECGGEAAHNHAKTIPAYLKAIRTERARSGFSLDKAAMEWCDAGVILLPCGRSAHLEAGWLAGQGKPCIVYLSDQAFEPELMYLLCSHIVTNDEGLVDSLRWMTAFDFEGPALTPKEIVLLAAEGGEILSKDPDVLRYEPVGSSLYHKAPHDVDFAVLVRQPVHDEHFDHNTWIERFIVKNPGWKVSGDYDTEGGLWSSIACNHLNFIVTQDAAWYEKFLWCSTINQGLQLEHKWQRVALCRLLRDGKSLEQLKNEWQAQPGPQVFNSTYIVD